MKNLRKSVSYLVKKTMYTGFIYPGILSSTHRMSIELYWVLYHLIDKTV